MYPLESKVFSDVFRGIKREHWEEKSLNRGKDVGKDNERKKRKSAANISSKLIHSKRAHLEQKISTSQRDSILIAEAREDMRLNVYTK